MTKPITPSQLIDYLIALGYHPELSAPYIANTYLSYGIQKNWNKQTIKDLKQFESETTNDKL